MLVFDDATRFPDNIAYGSSGGPEFRTTIHISHTGVENRVQSWETAKHRYNVSYGIRDTEDMDTVRKFFYTHRGRLIGFRFKDWADYTLTDEPIGTGDGVLRTFQTIKTYELTEPDNAYVRTIVKLVPSTVVVKVDDVVIPQGATVNTVSVNHNTGLITFGTSVIPGSGDVITITGEFDVPVRFDTDTMAAAHAGWQTEEWSSIPLVEIPPSEFTA